jgi:hypothetical protein
LQLPRTIWRVGYGDGITETPQPAPARQHTLKPLPRIWRRTVRIHTLQNAKGLLTRSLSPCGDKLSFSHHRGACELKLIKCPRPLRERITSMADTGLRESS